MRIVTDDFTRHYKIINQNDDIVFSSGSEILLPNIQRYYEYASAIDSLSVVYYNLTKKDVILIVPIVIPCMIIQRLAWKIIRLF